jgi:hypothetical protein
MTWFAHHIFAIPAKGTLKTLTDNSVMSKSIYWVRDLSGHQWFDPKKQHDLPSGGLLVIRPVGDPDGHYTFWYEDEESIVSWPAFEEADDTEIAILPSQVHEDNPDFNLIDYPPASFLKWLKQLSIITKTTTAYYHCEMWGGDIEIEHSWVFTPDEIVYLFVPSDENSVKLMEYHPGKPRKVKTGNVLVETLKHFGLNLPTPYFALHTRSFPWHKYKYNV